MVVDETRGEPAGAVDPVRVVLGEACRLLVLGHRRAVFILDIAMLERGGVQHLAQRQVEDADIDREIVAVVAVVVPCLARCQHQVARAEGDILALDASKVALPGEPDANCVDRMPVRQVCFDGCR